MADLLPGRIRSSSGVEAGYDAATEPERPGASLGELLSEMTTEVSTLFRKEIELARPKLNAALGHAPRG